MTGATIPLLEHLLAPLRLWLDDPETEDIALNRPGEAWVYRRGAWEAVDVPLTFADFHELAILAGSYRRQDVDERSPLCSTELPNGERIQACLPPTVPAGTISLSLRVHEQDIALLDDIDDRYIVDGWNQPSPHKRGRDLSEVLAAYDANDFKWFLRAAIDARLNGLLSGPTGAGKTTLSKTVISSIPPTKRIITIEDTIELKLIQPNVVRLLYSKGDLTGTGVSSGDLVEAGMRMRPDIFLLQELRDDAAYSYLKAVCSGHPGSWTTIHGDSPAAVMRRLALLVKGAPEGRALDRADLLSLLSEIDVIIPLDRNSSIKPRVHDVWFAADVARRDESAANLLAA